MKTADDRRKAWETTVQRLAEKGVAIDNRAEVEFLVEQWINGDRSAISMMRAYHAFLRRQSPMLSSDDNGTAAILGDEFSQFIGLKLRDPSERKLTTAAVDAAWFSDADLSVDPPQAGRPR